MGIKRLFKALSNRFEPGTLDRYSGKHFGIDGRAWLYQVFFSINESMERIKIPIVRKMEGKFKMLQQHGIRFTVVIDGRKLEGKELALEKRRKKRELCEERAREAEEICDVEAEAAYEKYSQELPIELVYFFIEYLKFRDFDYIVAPYEADSQLAYMYKNGFIDYIAAEDSDFLAMNCVGLIRGIKRENSCVHFNSLPRPTDGPDDKWTILQSLKEWQHTLFCIMNGCDYIDNVPGIGFVTLLRFFGENRELERKEFAKKLEAYLKLGRGAKPPNFVADSFMILNAFCAQIVFDPVNNVLKHMGPPEGAPEEYAKYTGVFFPDEKRFARGDLDFTTFKPRPLGGFDFAKTIEYINETTSQNFGVFANLCEGARVCPNFELPMIYPSESAAAPTVSTAATRGRSVANGRGERKPSAPPTRARSLSRGKNEGSTACPSRKNSRSIRYSRANSVKRCKAN